MEQKKIIQELSEPLGKDDIELRIGATKSNGFSLLLYKTARTDVKRLNKVLGLNWANVHFYDEKKLLCCEISVYNGTEWVNRSDVGIESRTQKEKGSYSDSFKRAGFRWGIGLELYNSPFIWIKWEMKEKKPIRFYTSNLEITDYKVEKGKPKLTINYNNKFLWSNLIKKRIMTEQEFEKAKENPGKALDYAKAHNITINSKWLQTLTEMNEILEE